MPDTNHRDDIPVQPQAGTPPACQPLTPRTVRARFLLLVVDPDTAASKAVAAALQDRQIDVVCTDDPADAMLQAGALLPDAVLTAAQVPPMRGSAIARALHTRGCIPTLVGVGEDDGPEASLALANGATACVPRPYRITDILPILRAISPDTAADFHAAIQVGALRLDPAAVEVRFHGRRIELPLREFQLLHLLMLHAGRVVTRAQINQLVWSRDDEPSNTLNVHIRRLRTRLGDDLRDPKIIISVRGLGYRLDIPDTPTHP
ncbi:response regulator transcription factor [Plantactinospora sp. KLBMP9567]|uniref:winged helix-turn-helix transcriptional regulator n=1 Tax=Plantactinospora sp. KLBMP9567 TaxID=3085900 RepID=UPI002982A4CC|nr:response regulator transcription factor [Plantactinospora sp. KLBMP9567]MDW5329601.1 response regulator transcription factor [Plantactinospora sp. KLBMP9567]